MTEEYISGYLEAISRVKDIITPNVGGFNCFFSIAKNPELDLKSNIIFYLEKSKPYYDRYKHETFTGHMSKIELVAIPEWENKLQDLIAQWTCDKELESLRGRNGYPLSEYLVKFLLKDFFKGKKAELYKMLPDWGLWPWGDHMSEEYVFETNDKIYIMHFGEST